MSFLRNLAVRLSERGSLGTSISASDLADFCLSEEIPMPGLPPDKQTPEEGRKQIGRIMSKLLGEKTELLFDQFRMVREKAKVFTSAGNDEMLNRYTFTNTAPPPG